MSREAPLDPHRVLGVAPGADDDAVRTAWRRTAQQCHPDRGGDTEAFRRARLAVELLLPKHQVGAGGGAPTVTRHLGSTAVARRWWRRRRDRARHPRVS